MRRVESERKEGLEERQRDRNSDLKIYFSKTQLRKIFRAELFGSYRLCDFGITLPQCVLDYSNVTKIVRF